MKFEDLVRKSRSYRSFDRAVRIPEETLCRWINVARFCPSSSNLQMLKFRPVFAEDECAEVFANTRWAGRIKDVRLPPEGHEPVAYIVICADENAVPGASKFLKDVGITAQTLMLAAAEDGFGGCMIGSFRPDGVTEALALPDGIVPLLVLALGKPDETVVLTDEAPDGSVTYYRENGIHYVQKRKTENLIVGRKL